jgi:hypothetical protein
LVRVPRFSNRLGKMEVVVPYWLLVLPAAALATAPWEKWRVGLGGLLIVATLVTGLLALFSAVAL